MISEILSKKLASVKSIVIFLNKTKLQSIYMIDIAELSIFIASFDNEGIGRR